MNTLKFEITLDEANIILASLGKQPFEAVASLVKKMQEQAQPQVAEMQKAAQEKAELEQASSAGLTD